MSIYDEVARVAHELFEKSGRIHGRDMENWLEAERIVHAGAAKVKNPGAATAKEKKTPTKARAAKTAPKKEGVKKIAAGKTATAAKKKKT
jgi:hypothetical protein